MEASEISPAPREIFRDLFITSLQSVLKYGSECPCAPVSCFIAVLNDKIINPVRFDATNNAANAPDTVRIYEATIYAIYRRIGESFSGNFFAREKSNVRRARARSTEEKRPLRLTTA